MTNRDRHPLTSFHWGTYRVEARDDEVVALHPFEEDPDPSPIGQGYVGVLNGPDRITAPMVRKSWLEGGPGAAGELRGRMILSKSAGTRLSAWLPQNYAA